MFALKGSMFVLKGLVFTLWGLVFMVKGLIFFSLFGFSVLHFMWVYSACYEPIVSIVLCHVMWWHHCNFSNIYEVVGLNIDGGSISCSKYLIAGK